MAAAWRQNEVTASAGGTLANFNGSGGSYTVDFTAANTLTTPTTVTLTIAADAFADEAGNPNAEYDAFTITISPRQVTATPIVTPQGSYVNLANASTFTVTVGGLVTGASVTVTAMDTDNNVLSVATTATGTTWAPALDLSDTSGLTDGTITITATASETGKDPATSTQATVTRDTAPPTVAITGDTTVTVGDTVSLTLTLTDAASGSGLTADEVTASAGGTLTNFNGSAPSYTVDFTADNTLSTPTTVTLTVAANAFTDMAGNPNAEDSSFTITISPRQVTATPIVTPQGSYVNLANASTFTVTVGGLVTGASVTVTAMDS